MIQKRPDGIFGTFMTRPVSHLVAFTAFKMNLSPNFISVLSFLFCVGALPFVVFQAASPSPMTVAVSVSLWWLGAIFDAADGDLARYSGRGSQFGGWLDSFLDRIKEFAVFSVMGYLAYRVYDTELYLLIGIVAVFTNLMSGYISDTKKLFVTERKPVVVFSKRFSFGMADTRDFIIISGLILNDFRIPLFIYSSAFMIALLIQTVWFFKNYGSGKTS